MATPIIRGLVAVFDQPSCIAAAGTRNVFRKGCFDHIDLADPAIKSMINHEREIVHAGLRLWISDTGLEFEIRPGDSSRAKLAVAGIQSGLYRGASIGCEHPAGRQVRVGGSLCDEVSRVARITDISICREAANSFCGVALIDESQAPRRDVLPFPSRPTEQPSRSPVRGQTARDAQNWHREIVASAKLGMQKKMEQLAAEKLRFSPGSVRGIY